MDLWMETNLNKPQNYTYLQQNSTEVARLHKALYIRKLCLSSNVMGTTQQEVKTNSSRSYQNTQNGDIRYIKSHNAFK